LYSRNHDRAAFVGQAAREYALALFRTLDGEMMSAYQLQKLLRDVNRKPACRAAYFESPARFAEGYDLTEEERQALLKLDLGQLYAKGVHGLILRPFSLLHKVTEPDYLNAIRGEN
jgi:Aromatic-ring-opening dioxygenase LigAB, LigA subunit